MGSVSLRDPIQNLSRVRFRNRPQLQEVKLSSIDAQHCLLNRIQTAQSRSEIGNPGGLRVLDMDGAMRS